MLDIDWLSVAQSRFIIIPHANLCQAARRRMSASDLLSQAETFLAYIFVKLLGLLVSPGQARVRLKLRVKFRVINTKLKALHEWHWALRGITLPLSQWLHDGQRLWTTMWKYSKIKLRAEAANFFCTLQHCLMSRDLIVMCDELVMIVMCDGLVTSWQLATWVVITWHRRAWCQPGSRWCHEWPGTSLCLGISLVTVSGYITGHWPRYNWLLPGCLPAQLSGAG